MNEAQDERLSHWGPLPCSCIVYRAVLNNPFRDRVSGKILRGAFLRRKPKKDGTPRDVKGLSVGLYQEEGITRNQIVERIRSTVSCFAIGSLHVGRIRDVEANPSPSLDVIQNEADHANIKGLPAYGENDAEAERLATHLAEQTRTFWMKP